MPQTQRYTLPRPPGDAEVATARLVAAGALGVWEQPDALVGWFADRDAPVPAGGRWETEAEVDWQAEWKAGIGPVRAGRFVIVPTWLDDEVPHAAGDVRLVLDPGRAFGSGHHATTTQCLELLDRCEVAGARVLDVGCGTGVLAIAAARLGAGDVLAVDVDADAVAVTDENTARNGVAVRTAVGSTDTAAADGPFDVVLANLVTDTLVALAGELAARTRPGGALVASGIADERADRVVAALVAAGFERPALVRRDGWTALLAHRPAPPGAAP